MRSVQENMNVKDDFSVYGENVANRIRGANQNMRAISIAKNRIDNILFQLEMGAFSVSEEETYGARQHLYQFPYNINNRYYPEMNTSQATPTHSSDYQISVCTTSSSPYPSPSSVPSQPMHSSYTLQQPSSPYPSPSSVQSQPTHSSHTLQQQNQSTPMQYQPQTQTQIIWQSPESQQPQSQIAFPQQSSDIAELNEYLVRRANSR